MGGALLVTLCTARRMARLPSALAVRRGGAACRREYSRPAARDQCSDVWTCGVSEDGDEDRSGSGSVMRVMGREKWGEK